MNEVLEHACRKFCEIDVEACMCNCISPFACLVKLYACIGACIYAFLVLDLLPFECKLSIYKHMPGRCISEAYELYGQMEL